MKRLPHHLLTSMSRTATIAVSIVIVLMTLWTPVESVSAYSADSGPGLRISTSMAQCRAHCINQLAPSLVPGEESCKHSVACTQCWSICAQLAVHYPIWSSQCRQHPTCNDGCQTACTFFTKANATPPPPPSSPSSPSHHPSVYIPPTPPTHPTPPARLSMEFDDLGAARWVLRWVDHEQIPGGGRSPSEPSAPETGILPSSYGPSVRPLVPSSTSATSSSGGSSNGPVSPSRCDTCGACGVVFAVFTRQKHHLPWVLYRQTQANHITLDGVKSGTQLQLVAVANCGIVSVIITPYNPPVVVPLPSRGTGLGNGAGSTGNADNFPRGDLYVHEQRYETLAQHYAKKKLHDVGNDDDEEESSPVANSNSNRFSSEMSETPQTSTSWNLHYNASVNMTDLIYTHIWWQPKFVNNSDDFNDDINRLNDQSRVDGSMSPSAASDSNMNLSIDYLVTWEDQSGTVKGHSMTSNPFISFDLWPHTIYKIQAQVVMGPLIEPRVSNTLVFDAANIYKELSQKLKKKHKYDESDVSDTSLEDAPSSISDVEFGKDSSDQFASQTTDRDSSGRSIAPSAPHNAIEAPGSGRNLAGVIEPTPKSSSDSYVYANVDRDYSPLYVETAPYNTVPAMRPPQFVSSEDDRSSGILPDNDTEIPMRDVALLQSDSVESLGSKPSKVQTYNGHPEIRTNPPTFGTTTRSNPAENTIQLTESNTQGDAKLYTVSPGLPGEVLAGIITAFVFVLIIIVALVFYMRYYIKSVNSKKGTFRTDGYDTESSVSSKGTEKSDDCTPSNGKKEGQWGNRIRHPTQDTAGTKYAFGGGGLGGPNTSISNGIEFNLHSSGSLLPAGKYTPLAPINDNSNVSGNTSTTLISDTATTNTIYANNSECGSNSTAGSYSGISGTNVRYTTGPSGMHGIPCGLTAAGCAVNDTRGCRYQMYTGSSPGYHMQEEYAEIPPPTNASDVLPTLYSLQTVQHVALGSRSHTPNLHLPASYSQTYMHPYDPSVPSSSSGCLPYDHTDVSSISSSFPANPTVYQPSIAHRPNRDPNSFLPMPPYQHGHPLDLPQHSELALIHHNRSHSTGTHRGHITPTHNICGAPFVEVVNHLRSNSHNSALYEQTYDERRSPLIASSESPTLNGHKQVQRLARSPAPLPPQQFPTKPTIPQKPNLGMHHSHHQHHPPLPPQNHLMPQ